MIAGLGSLGVHSMLITERGCAGRLSTLVLDAEVPATAGRGDARLEVEHCAHLRHGSCRECVDLCPVGAVRVDGTLAKHRCWERCRAVAERFRDVGTAEVCGKCAVGRCALGSG
ncbi:MAG: hypothetical protein ABIG03_01110 [Candidatus Eisenbacteria bacterium]